MKRKKGLLAIWLWVKNMIVTDDADKSMNFNSILMFIVLGVLGWLGFETRSTSIGLAEIRTAQTINNRDNAASMIRMEDHLNSSVPRREFDLRIIAVETKLADMNLRIHEMEISTKLRK